MASARMTLNVVVSFEPPSAEAVVAAVKAISIALAGVESETWLAKELDDAEKALAILRDSITIKTHEDGKGEH